MLSRQTGASIGLSPGLPLVMVPHVRGPRSAKATLDRLLKHTNLHAVAVGPNTYRIELRPRAKSIARAKHSAPMSVAAGEVVVTATKRDTRIGAAATAVAVVDRAALQRLGDAPDTGTLAAIVNGLTVTNLGPGRNRLFIRGIADSPFDGFGQSSVSVQIDEARLTYDAPDPDLRLIDIAQVEILKGPQGPLYGTGALGGVLRIVPEKPELAIGDGIGPAGRLRDFRRGRGGGERDAVLNLPLVRDRLGLRLVGYRLDQGGWIDTAGGAANINRGRTSGARLGLRARPGGDWVIDAQAITQASSIADSQYVEARRTLTRAARLAEPQDTDLTLLSLTANGSLGNAQGDRAHQRDLAGTRGTIRCFVQGGRARSHGTCRLSRPPPIPRDEQRVPARRHDGIIHLAGRRVAVDGNDRRDRDAGRRRERSAGARLAL